MFISPRCERRVPDRRVADRRLADRRRVPRDGPDRRQHQRRVLCATGLALAACLSSARPANAQIYSWRDANGTLVLSDRPLSSDAKTFAVTNAPQVRTTRPAPTPQRAVMYDRLIDEHATSRGVRPDLVRAVIQVESNFNPVARSPKGALGLMQLMPATAAELGVLNPFNVVENIRGGVAYLRQLLDRYNNNEELALAAYNAGPTAVDRYGSKVPPYRETKQYVNKILSRTPAPRPTTIYKSVEIVDGRPVVRFTEKKPSSGPYEVIR
jgi:soluble lytic murein transglycosylase-like protein